MFLKIRILFQKYDVTPQVQELLNVIPTVLVVSPSYKNSTKERSYFSLSTLVNI